MRRRVIPTPEPKKPAKKVAKREHLIRNGMIISWDFLLSAHGASGPSFPTRWGEASLSASGDFDEPVNGITAFNFTFRGVDAKSVELQEMVGMFSRAKVALDAQIFLPWPDLDALMTFAAAGRTLHCSASFEKPRYGWGDIFSFWASTKPLE